MHYVALVLALLVIICGALAVVRRRVHALWLLPFALLLAGDSDDADVGDDRDGWRTTLEGPLAMLIGAALVAAGLFWLRELVRG